MLIDINSVPQALLTEYLTPEKERASVNKSHQGDSCRQRSRRLQEVQQARNNVKKLIL